MKEIISQDTGRMIHILVVEDNPDHAFLVRESLESQHDYIVVPVDTVAAAFDEMKSGRYQVVLTDYSLPDGSGLDLIDWARNCLVIVMTGQGDEKTAVDAMHRGAYDYLVKDSLFQEILPDIIRRALEKQRTDGEVGRLREQLREENEKLAHANARLRELDEIKSEFLSTASHELRTPLTIIREFVAFMRDELAGPINAEQKECLDSTLKNCDRLGNLINDILDLQKIESGRLRLTRTAVSIETVLRNCAADFIHRFDAKGITVNLDFPTGLPPVLADEEKIMQVLINLLGNACKFTPSGGDVSLCARAGDGESVQVDISDTGPGLSPEDCRRIFDKFVQVNRVIGAGAHGTGLGLAIAKNIVRLHEGEIYATSRLGRGTTFSFFLPVYTEASALVARIHDRLAVMHPGEDQLTLVSLGPESDSPSLVGDLDHLQRLISARFAAGEDDIFRADSENALYLVTAGNETSIRDRLQGFLREITESLPQATPIAFSVTSLTSDQDVEGLLAEARRRRRRFVYHGREQRVLIVDDDLSVLETLTDVLQSSDIDVRIEATGDGYDACILFGQTVPEVVILDVNMPGFSGRDVLRQIKSGARGERTGVIVVSGVADVLPEMKILGADICLAKPFDINDIIDGVKRLLERRTPNPAAAPAEGAYSE